MITCAMDKEMLTELIALGLSQRDIAAECHSSQGNVRHWLKKHGLVTIGHGPKPCLCLQCGETDYSSMMSKGGGRVYKSLCKRCHSSNTVARGRANKSKYVAYLGGSCVRCGYARCLDALEFHHKDPNEKDVTVKSIRYWGLDRAKRELDRCMLVCSNCHREVHVAMRKEAANSQ